MCTSGLSAGTYELWLDFGDGQNARRSGAEPASPLDVLRSIQLAVDGWPLMGAVDRGGGRGRLESMPRRRKNGPMALRVIAEDATSHVLGASTRAAIEKMAEEFAREMLADEEFRRQLREGALRAARAVAESLRKSPS